MHRHPYSRRRFIKTASAMGVAGALPGMSVMRQARAAASQPRTLIVVHLAGGNDTLNTIIPYTDPNYATVRGALAIPAAEQLPISERQALHPALAGLKRLYDAGKVAIVNGVGYPSFDYSHFEAMQIYWQADPARRSTTGWLGRAVDAALDEAASTNGSAGPLRGTAIGSETPPSLLARNFTAPLLPPNPNSFRLAGIDLRQRDALARLMEQPLSGTNFLYDAFLRNSRAALYAYNTVQTAGALPTAVTYPSGSLASGLRFAAQLMRVDPDVQIITLAQGGYDTHERQLSRHAELLGTLGASLEAFVDDIATYGLGPRTLVLLWSEFARRIAPNASDGTDHGSSQAVVLIGDGVRAGVINAPPSLDPADTIDRGNLAMAIDFRAIYASVLDGWLGIDSRAVLGERWSSVPVLL